MKAVILAGGSGTRLSEETKSKPKPMIKIGGKPILWHIMNPEYSRGIVWNDKTLKIAWPLKPSVISENDANLKTLQNGGLI